MHWYRIVALGAPLTAAALVASMAFAETLDLPKSVPVPEVFPPSAGNIAPRHLGDTPVPEPRPDADEGADGGAQSGDKADGNTTTGTAETPATAPIPKEPPPQAGKQDEPERGRTGTGGQDKPEKPKMQPDPRSTPKLSLLMPPAEIACRQRLRELGVAFADRPAETSEDGCSLPYPMSVRTLGTDVSLEPEALMNCAMAEAAARFMAGVVAPASRREFGADLKSIGQASAYVCRPRNGTTKLSEHAFGNALDIARFGLSDGKSVDVVLRPEEREARFLGAVRKAACGPFKTVLGPGNPDHETHLHFDLAPRRHGGTVCE